MRALTRRQRDVLKFIISQRETAGLVPSLRDIAGHLGVRSKNGVVDHLIALEVKGFIRRERGKARHITVLRGPDGEPYPQLAGEPLERLTPEQRRALLKILMLHEQHELANALGYTTSDVRPFIRAAMEQVA